MKRVGRRVFHRFQCARQLLCRHAGAAADAPPAWRCPAVMPCTRVDRTASASLTTCAISAGLRDHLANPVDDELLDGGRRHRAGRADLHALLLRGGADIVAIRVALPLAGYARGSWHAPQWPQRSRLFNMASGWPLPPQTPFVRACPLSISCTSVEEHVIDDGLVLPHRTARPRSPPCRCRRTVRQQAGGDSPGRARPPSFTFPSRVTQVFVRQPRRAASFTTGSKPLMPMVHAEQLAHDGPPRWGFTRSLLPVGPASRSYPSGQATADEFALAPGGAHLILRALSNQFALVFAKGRQDVEHQSAHAAVGAGFAGWTLASATLWSSKPCISPRKSTSERDRRSIL